MKIINLKIINTILVILGFFSIFVTASIFKSLMNEGWDFFWFSQLLMWFGIFLMDLGLYLHNRTNLLKQKLKDDELLLEMIGE